MGKNNQLVFLKLSFIIGAVADFVVGVNWLLISLGYDLPNMISSFKGDGTDYRFAMYMCTMFMFGWTAMLLWGYLRPLERRGVLIITSILLLLSIVIELRFYRDLLPNITGGVALRLLIIGTFTFSYFYSCGAPAVGWHHRALSRCLPRE